MISINCLTYQLYYIIVDFETLTKDSVGEHFQDGDVFFNAMGTTRKVAGSAVCINIIYVTHCVQLSQFVPEQCF